MRPSHDLRRVSWAVVAGLLLAAPACVEMSADNRWVDREERRFDVKGTPTLTLTTFDGSIEVRSWDRPEVLVVIERRATSERDGQSITVEAEQRGDDISVSVKDGSEFGFFGQRSGSLVVTAPRDTRLEAHSGDGRIDVRDLSGPIDARTGDGAIRLDEVTGPVEVRSGDGSILVGGVLTSLRATSGDGGVTIRAREGSTAREPWNVMTGDGSVLLELPQGFGAELEALTGDGRITVRDVEIQGIEPDARERNRLRGRIGAGGARMSVHTGDGSITLRRF